jgi:hypothetical protein
MAKNLMPTHPLRALALVADLYRRYVEAVSAHPRRWALGMGLACVPAFVLSALYFADVRAGLQELLPPSAPAVRAIEQIHARLGGRSHLIVIAQSDDREQNHRFIDELAARFEALRLPEVRTIQARITEERAWIERRAPLLLPRDRFDSLMDELDGAVHGARSKALSLGLDKEEDAKDPFVGLQKRLDDEMRGRDRFPNGYVESADGRTAVMVLWLEGSEVELEPSEKLLSTAQREAEALRARYPGLRVAYNGNVANLVEEHAAILSDLSLSSLLVFALVTGVLALYFRSARAVLAVGVGLVPGLLFTFAFGRLFAGPLNSNTAFLGSIVAGNGINYPIIFLAYYRASDPALSLPQAIFSTARRALPGTLGAAATASAAYAGLTASTFKGFSQFGLIGGVGMLATWLLTFLSMPIVIALLRPPREARSQTRAQERMDAFFARPLAPRLVAGLVVALMLACGVTGALRARRDGLYEMDLRKLRNRDSLAHGAASWDRKMNEIFGVWLSPVVAIARDEERRRVAAAELKRALVDGSQAVAERVESIADVLPPQADQEERLARLRTFADRVPKLKKLAERRGAKVPEKAWRLLDLWLAPAQLSPITVGEVPRALRQGMTEVSGAVDRVVLLYPSLKIDYDDGRNVIRFADSLATAKLPDGTVTGGGFLFMAEVTRVVRDEAPRIVLTVCALVALVLVPVYLRRPRRIAVTVVTVTCVAVLAQALMLALGVKVNLLNFAAVPITIGVGADYVVNLYGAMDALGTDARRACARMGGAILLCSLTTVIGYLSLVVAQSGALRSFGWAAVAGEVMAVTAVLLVLPVIIERSGSRQAADCRLS